MSKISFNQEINFEYCVAKTVAPSVRRIVAENASALTFKGTNTYIVGKGDVAVIDPGPDIDAHHDALLSELKNERVTHILLTHTHVDHCEGLKKLKDATGAVIVGYGARDKSIRDSFKIRPSNKEFIDWDFAPEQELKDGDTLTGSGWEIKAIHTPGHAPDHLCYALSEENVLFSGDHVMAWNTSVIAPPEGHMGSYLNSLQVLLPRSEDVYFPGHGGRISSPQRVVKAYLVHRMWREAAIFKAIKDGYDTIPKICPKVYPDVDDALYGACALSILAHLEYLCERALVVPSEPGRPSLDASFQLP